MDQSPPTPEDTSATPAGTPTGTPSAAPVDAAAPTPAATAAATTPVVTAAAPSATSVDAAAATPVEAPVRRRADRTGKTTRSTGKAARTGKAAGSARGTRRAAWPLVLAGSATGIVAVVAIAAGSLFGGDAATVRLDTAAQVLPVGDARANCVGPTQLLSGAAAGADPDFAAASSGTKSQLSAVVLSDADGVLPGSTVQGLNADTLATLAEPPDAPAPSATAAPLTGVAKTKAVVAANRDMAGPSMLLTLPYNGANSRSTGAVVVSAGDGDLQQLAAATCQLPSNELWLSGASTTVGRTAILTLTNSTASAATVDLELFGAAGRVQATGAKNIVVPVGTAKSIVLSGLAPNEARLSVHVKSSGGAVSALIQQSVLRGLTAGGVDYLAPHQAPATTATIPGVRVQDAASAAAITAQSGYADASAMLQVTVPGTTDAVVEVTAYGPSGQVALPNGGVFTATAGRVSELSLAGLAQGTYSLTLSADYAVAAAVRLSNSTAPGAAVDLALTGATSRLGANHLLTLPGLAQSTLALTAPTGAATATMVPISAAGVLGAAQTIEVKPGSTTEVDLKGQLGADTAAVLLSTAGEAVYGTQLLGNGGTANIAVLPIAAPPTESPSLKLSTGY